MDLKLKNRIDVYDIDTKELLFSKENLVVDSGRKFVLEKLTNIGIGNINHSVDRRLLYFKIGDGGVADASKPMLINFPVATDTDLINPLPFRTYDGTKLNEYCKSVNGSFYGKYFSPLDDSSRWDIDATKNKICFKAECQVSRSDARGEVINEVGIFFGSKDGDNNIIDDGMYARITFASKYCIGTNGFSIIYHAFV